MIESAREAADLGPLPQEIGLLRGKFSDSFVHGVIPCSVPSLPKAPNVGSLLVQVPKSYMSISGSFGQLNFDRPVCWKEPSTDHRALQGSGCMGHKQCD